MKGIEEKKKMKKILGLFAIVLGLTGCSTPIAPEVELPTQSEVEESTQDETVEEQIQDETEEPPQNKVEQNKIEWIVTDDESREASITPTWETDTLEYVTIEEYKVPCVNGKLIQEKKELLETKKLYRGDILTVHSSKDYDYKYVTCIKIIEFNRYSDFYAQRNEINFFDYKGTVGMEISKFYNHQIDTDNKGWKGYSYSVTFSDPVEGYFITYDFLDKSVSQNFYDEHKDGGRIIWDNN